MPREKWDSGEKRPGCYAPRWSSGARPAAPLRMQVLCQRKTPMKSGGVEVQAGRWSHTERGRSSEIKELGYGAGVMLNRDPEQDHVVGVSCGKFHLLDTRADRYPQANGSPCETSATNTQELRPAKVKWPGHRVARPLDSVT